MRWGLGWVCGVSDQYACWTERQLQSQTLGCLPADPGPAGDGGGSAWEGRPIHEGQSLHLDGVAQTLLGLMLILD